MSQNEAQLTTNSESDSGSKNETEAREETQISNCEYVNRKYSNFPVRSTSWSGLGLRSIYQVIDIADTRLFPQHWETKHKHTYIKRQFFVQSGAVFITLCIGYLLSPNYATVMLTENYTFPVIILLSLIHYIGFIIGEIILNYPNEKNLIYEGDWV